MKPPATLFLFAILFAHLSGAPASAEDSGAADASVVVKRLWNEAPHNAFTDLVRFQDRWVCGFREAPAHEGGVRDSRMRILVSDDWENWESAAALSDERGDIRDAKFAVMPHGRLMFLTAIQLFDRSEQSHQSLAWFTSDLERWEGPFDVGEPDIWLWGITWYEGTGYSIGYRTAQPRLVRLYKTSDGRTFEVLVDDLAIDVSYPNESKIVFDAEGVAHCLLRTDKRGDATGDDDGKARVGSSRPPYTDWTWKATDRYIGGPALLFLPDGRLLGGGRMVKSGQGPRTVLFQVDADSGVLSEWLTLPSGGDTSYPGLVWHEGKLWLSYYSSHEGKASIYIGQVPKEVFRSRDAEKPEVAAP